MPKKGSKPVSSTEMDKLSSVGESDDTFYTSTRSVSISLSVVGSCPDSGDWIFLVVFNGQVVLNSKVHPGSNTQLETYLPLDLKNQSHQLLVTENPLIFLLRRASSKGKQEPDPLLNTDNKAGATVDMFPLLIGEDKIFIRVPLVFIETGLTTELIVNVHIMTSESLEKPLGRVPFLITLVSAHCLPSAKDGTVYTAAISLDGVLDKPVMKFGFSLSTADAQNCVWASASNAGYAGNTALRVSNDDKFVPEDLTLLNTATCRTSYWNAMNRRLVDAALLRQRLTTPFLLEIAGVPKIGKNDIRGRYMCFVDAGVLLQPGVYSVTVCARLLFYNEARLPSGIGGLLDLPPVSGKQSARETDLIVDEDQHSAYVVLKFDLWEPLVPKIKLVTLLKNMGFNPPEGPAVPIDRLDPIPTPKDPTIDVRKIRKEGGALAVHKELSGLACRGAVPMNQGIRRTAANRLLMRVRSMLKQFPPGECSNIEWQDTVTRQHAACRRAVTSSFAPQPPQPRQPSHVAAARSRMAGNTMTSKRNDALVDNNNSKSPSPRHLLSKSLRYLEELHDSEAIDFICDALNICPRNRFLLWMFGGQEFDKGAESSGKALMALRTSVKGNYSDAAANTIGWAALHTACHWNKEPYGAFVAAQKMRKSFELTNEWDKFYQRWIDESGEEEVFWIPTVISSSDPFLFSAAFFLCLRCFKFTETLLSCSERGCASAGSRLGLKSKICPDIYYIRAASLVLRRQFNSALELIEEAIRKFGPRAMLSQMRATCLSGLRGWDRECQNALERSEKAGATLTPELLLKAAVWGMELNAEAALQRAAQCHKLAPCGQTAFAIAKIYSKMNEMSLAERWAAAAVKSDPLLTDGWAFLALLALYDNELYKAKALLRTAYQVGDISPDIEEQLKIARNIRKLEGLPDALVKDLCLCDFH